MTIIIIIIIIKYKIFNAEGKHFRQIAFNSVGGFLVAKYMTGCNLAIHIIILQMENQPILTL